MKATTVGLDIGKSVFQVHMEDATGRIVAQRRLRRAQVATFFARLPASVVGIEACDSAPYWGRTLRALGLIPAAYVKPLVRRNKTDARDAAAICAALKQPDMRFVRIKGAEQQAARGLERARELLVKQHTQLGNSVRSQLAEHGLVAAQGRRGFAPLIEVVAAGDARIPAALVPVLQLLLAQIAHLAAAIAELEERIGAAAKADPAMRRLATIPGIGPIVAHAIVAAVGDGRQFRTARDFAAWAGLMPQEHASAGKRRTQGISRQGDSRLRTLFARGAGTVMRTARARGARATAWQRGLLARRPIKVAVLAQAVKTARIAWAVLVSGQPDQAQRQASTSAAA